MDLLLSGLVFVSVALLVGTVTFMVFSEERTVSRALRTVSEWESSQVSVAEPQLRPFRARVIAPAVGAVSNLMRGLVPADARVRMQHRLDLAGNPGNLTPEGVAALRFAIAGGAFLIAIIGFALAKASITPLSVVGTVALAALGAVAPDIWIGRLRSRRQNEIQRSLPDMLDMLTISVQAGLGFDMALGKLVRSTSGPLSREFSRMLREVQAGVSRRDAFRHLGERTAVPELDAFIVAMVQADVFGVSISGILHTQSAELRKKRRARAEEKAQKAPVLMVFPIVLCILPATMLVILGPAVISIGRAFGMIK